MPEPITSYAEFWPHYLRAHARAGTRRLHYLGTGLGLLALAMAVITANPYWIGGAAIVGYGCAWIGHAVIEGNRPATFGHPIWSLVSDIRMLALWLAGRLSPELTRAGVGRTESVGRQ